jgi:hypothetical protein
MFIINKYMFISLGIDCGTANILKQLGLRNYSLPFDWVVTYEGITNIINNNFTNYLPKEHDNKYELLNKNSGTLFLHNNFPADIEQMNKRIDRFKNLLETSNEKIIFVRKSHGSHHHGEYNNVINDINDAINLDLLLLKKYPNLIYEIHVILICDNCFTNIAINENISNNIKIHNIARPYPINVNVTNPHYFDELCKKIFSQ